MAKTSTSCYGGNWGKDYTLTLEYTLNSQSVANNTSNITLKMYARKNNNYPAAWSTGSNPYWITVNGSKKVNSTRSMDFRNRNTVSMGSWTGNVSHNDNGRASITIGGGFTISGVTDLRGGDISKNWTLPTIPRYSRVTNLNISDVRMNQFKVNFSVDKAISDSNYSVNGGTWHPLSNGQVISITNFEPGETLKFKIRVKNKDSGLWTESNTRNVYLVRTSTYSINDIDINDNFSVNISRADSRITHNLKIKIWADSQNWLTIREIKGIDTSETVTFTESEKDLIYKNRTSSYRTDYTIELESSWGSYSKAERGEKKTLRLTDVNPTLAGTTYKDINSVTQNIIKNNQFILRNNSILEITTGIANAQKYATIKSYKITISGNEYNFSGNGASSEAGKRLNVGKINVGTNQTATVQVVDSRGLTGQVSLPIKVIDYASPQIIKASASRLNSYERQSYLIMDCRRAIIKNDADVNELDIRLRFKETETTEYSQWQNALGKKGTISSIFQNINVNYFIAEFDSSKSYDVQVQIKDKFSNWITTNVVILEGIALMKMHKDNIEFGVPIFDTKSGMAFMAGEVGENSNGNYAKFDNGLLLCWKHHLLQSERENIPWTFPQKFNPLWDDRRKSNSNIYGNVKLSGAFAKGENVLMNTPKIDRVAFVSNDNSSATIEVKIESLVSGREVDVMMFAMGRWK